MTIRVLRPGLLTTVQDRGRPGHQHDGVPAGGAMDDVALRVANWLVGNDGGAAALEATLVGPSLAFDEDTTIAVAGADMDARIDDRRLPPWWSARVRAGQVLTLEQAHAGCRAYIALAGGVDVPAVLGSRSTYTRAQFGRPLAARDVLRTFPRQAPPGGHGVEIHRLLPPRSTIRFVPAAGAGAAPLTAAARRAFATGEFTVSRDSDRMGIRLEGPSLEMHPHRELHSAGVAFGTIQLPPGGSPIVLMADRQTTGGYPRIGEVATVDLPLLAQARPGDAVRFEAWTRDEAEQAYVLRERTLRVLEAGLHSCTST